MLSYLTRLRSQCHGRLSAMLPLAALLVAGLTWAGRAVAQQPPQRPPEVIEPAPLTPPLPNGKPTTGPWEPPCPDCGCDPNCRCHCDDCADDGYDSCLACLEDHGDAWTLFDETCRGWNAGGWFSTGIYANAHGNIDNGPVGFREVGDGMTVDQMWGWVGKEMDNGGCGFDWGFRFDYVFGVDAPDTQAFGDESWDFGWNTGRDYGSAIPQLYVEAAYDDLEIKLGHFYTIIGYEVVQAPSNFFYSHSYTMVYGEPFTHSGALLTWNYSDHVTLQGGWTAGWDTGFDNRFDASTFLGSAALQLTENMRFIWALSAGDFGDGTPNNDGRIFMNSLVLEYQFAECWTYVFQHDLGKNSDLGDSNNEWYGINQYWLVDLNRYLSAGMRVEWFRDDDGARVGNGPGSYYACTLGLNYRANANVVFRPELRWDVFNRDNFDVGVFDGGREINQFAGGFDLIFTF